MIAETTCRLTVNGEARDWPGGSIADYLKAQGLDPAAPRIAVALNRTVVPRKAWAETRLGEGDRLELVGVFRGG